ncbi:MAG: HAD family hydrolase [Candidatus Heimdallarchaeaceae archaeon]
MKKRSIVIFDLDGTLIQSKIDYSGIRDRLWELLKKITTKRQFDELNNEIYTILELVNLIKKFDEKGDYFEQAWSIVEEYEMKGYEKAYVSKDVYDTLQTLKKKGYILVVLTNNSRKLTDYALDKYNLKNYFEYIITRDDVKESKPDPEGIFKILDKYKKDKREAIFIGDSWVDAETAVNAQVSFFYLGESGALGTRRKNVPAERTINKIQELLLVL